jgi:hypothetical protein
MQDPGCELRRISIPRTPVNKGSRKGLGLLTPGPLCLTFLPANLRPSLSRAASDSGVCATAL